MELSNPGFPFVANFGTLENKKILLNHLRLEGRLFSRGVAIYLGTQ